MHIWYQGRSASISAKEWCSPGWWVCSGFDGAVLYLLGMTFINFVQPKNFQMAQFQASSLLGLTLCCLSWGGLGTSGSRALRGLREAAVPRLTTTLNQSRMGHRGHRGALPRSSLPTPLAARPLLICKISLFELQPARAALPVWGFVCRHVRWGSACVAGEAEERVAAAGACCPWQRLEGEAVPPAASPQPGSSSPASLHVSFIIGGSVPHRSPLHAHRPTRFIADYHHAEDKRPHPPPFAGGLVCAIPLLE